MERGGRGLPREARHHAPDLADGAVEVSPRGEKAIELLGILEGDPFQTPPPYVKLPGDLAGAYSRRINIQHWSVYQVLEKDKTVTAGGHQAE